MSGQGAEKTSSDESKSPKSGEEIEDPQKALLEEEIKKIISDLDIKFEDPTPDDDDGTTTVKSSSPAPGTGQSSARWEERETPQKRAESASTVSGATVVQHQRVPLKVTTSHVRSEQQDWPSSPRPLMPVFGYQTHYDESHTIGGQYNAPALEFYRPERDEITEQTTTSETLISTQDSTTYGLTTPSTQTHRRGILPPLAEESSGVLRPPVTQNVFQMHGSRAANGLGHEETKHAQPQEVTRPQEPYNTDYHPRLPEYQSRLPEYHSQYQPEYSPPYQEHQPSQPQNQQIKEKVDRYNSTHMTYVPVKIPEKPRRSLTDYFISKGKSFFRKSNDSDSGEVIPQLYKASIKNGTTPARFTFKAVTGCQPGPCCCCSKCTGRAPFYGYDDRQSFGGSRDTPLETYVQPQGPPPIPVPIYEPPCNPCCCKEPAELDKKKTVQTKTNCPSNCEVTTLPPPDGAKTKAYYTDLGCGYISQSSVPEKVDIYCFDQLNTGFFRTSDHPPPLFADIAIQRTEKYATVFWAEIFGAANVITAFIIAMILQTFKFILQGILRPILIGFVQLLSDYLIKPTLTLLYNGFTQPVSIFLYNVIASIRDVMQPLAKGVGYFVELVAVVLRAIRLVEVKNVTNITPCGPQTSRY